MPGVFRTASSSAMTPDDRHALGLACVERIALPVGLRPRRVDEGDALRHHAPHARSLRRRHEIARALDAQPRILFAHGGHLRRIAHVRQIGQLMDDDIGLRRDHRAPQAPRRRTHRPPRRARRAPRSWRSCRRPRGAGDRMAGVTQQLEQRLPDHAGRAGDEDIHRSRSLRSRHRRVHLRGVVIFEILDRLAAGQPPDSRPSASRPPCRSSCSARCSG